LQRREEHWAIVDLLGKGGHVRTVPIPDWVVAELNNWLRAPEIDRGRVFRKVTKMGRIWGDSMTEKGFGTSSSSAPSRSVSRKWHLMICNGRVRSSVNRQAANVSVLSFPLA
jgi:hypothetical protein